MTERCLRFNINYLPGQLLGQGFYGNVYAELNSYGMHIMKI